jgi:dihydrodipicolinate synthase/N-acetylneuraminate lyase
MRTLDTQTLRGLWAAVPTPFVGGGAIDFGRLAENCRTLQRVGADGIYTTDSDGEFYALEMPEFGRLAREFGGIMADLGGDAQMGVTWINTAGVIDRMKASVDAGITTVHVALPFFMPLVMADVLRFFEALARAVPAARWVYYAHPSCLPLLKGRDLARLAQAFPQQLIGTKLNAYDLPDLTDVFLHAPGLAHFGGERNLFSAGPLGAVGCYSYWINSLPRWTRRFFDACLAGDMVQAREWHLKLQRWETVHLAEARAQGYRYGVLSKAKGAVAGLLRDDGSTRAPYHPMPPELLERLRRDFLEYWREEQAAE